MSALFAASRQDLPALIAALEAQHARVWVANVPLGERLPVGVAAGR